MYGNIHVSKFMYLGCYSISERGFHGSEIMIRIYIRTYLRMFLYTCKYIITYIFTYIRINIHTHIYFIMYVSNFIYIGCCNNFE
jgi:Ca2+-dependent lipid-binding protein